MYANSALITKETMFSVLPFPPFSSSASTASRAVEEVTSHAVLCQPLPQQALRLQAIVSGSYRQCGPL